MHVTVQEWLLAVIGCLAMGAYLLLTNRPSQPPPSQPGNFIGALTIIVIIGLIWLALPK